MPEIIAVDCDEVIADTVQAVLDFHQGTYNGKPITREQVTEFLWHEIPGYNASETYTAWYLDTFFASDAVRYIPVIPGALAGLQKLKTAGYCLKVITSRGNIAHRATEQYIQENFYNIFDDVVFGAHANSDHFSFDKAAMMQHIGASWLIDDAKHNCINAVKKGFKAIMPHRPRNQDGDIPKDIYRAMNWDEKVDLLITRL